MQIREVTENHEQQPLATFAEKAYLDYSMYVVLDRALPNIADGLKPVQRRIVYAMSELGLSAGAKFKKSARTIGDVLGKFHPHGDTACYEAMVLMAQPFSYRYPLVDGQGNWGSIDDPKSFAAMRYTEARLSPYAELLLTEVNQGTVDWGQNFDGTLQEPTLLPARVPHILLNGTTGIAVGMATDIPPHNLKEVVTACVHLLDNPRATLEDICEHIKAPDFPSGGEIITSPQDILAIYQNGTGSITMRATYVTEDNDIIITSLPYQASGAKILEQIAQQMQAKKLPMIADLRDESDHENPIRLVITPRSNRVAIEPLMSHLFATTDLEKSCRINLNMIGTNGRPQVKSLLKLLQEWLEHRNNIVRRRLQFRLDQVLSRLNILDGLLIAFLNIDEVIHIIRTADNPKAALIARFQLNTSQAEAILELRLRHLAKLEEMKIRGEQEELAKERKTIEQTLASNKKLTALIRSELLTTAEKLGDARRSKIVKRQAAQPLQEENIIPTEAITVVLSQQGWIRAAKGHDIDPTALSYKTGDAFKMAAHGRSNQFAVFLDSSGRSYSLPAHALPSARGQGEPLTSRITPPSGANFVAVLLGEPCQRYVLASNAGYGFIVTLEELYCKQRQGKAVLKLPAHAKLMTPVPVDDIDKQYLAAATNEGRLLLFPVNNLPLLARGKGNKIINIPTSSAAKGEEYMVGLAILAATNKLVLYVGKRKLELNITDLKNYQGQRGQRGNKLPRAFLKLDRLTTI